jgi:phospholipase C
VNLKQIFFLSLAALCLDAPALAGTSFQHIIVVVQENRTPDNLFYGLCATANCAVPPGPGQYDILTSAWLDRTAKGGTTNPTAVQLAVGYELSHKHSAFVAMCDLKGSRVCAMDGAANVNCSSKKQACPAKAAFGYVDNSKGSVQPYVDLVQSYGWANYFFQTNQGPSFAAHQFLFGATSAPSADDDFAGTFAAENTNEGDPTAEAGCAASKTAKVSLINAQGVEYTKVYPCFEHQTLSDLLDEQGVSWRYYGTNPNGIWMAPNAISYICEAHRQKCNGSEWKSNVDLNPSDVLSDVSTNCKLAGVSWVTPDGTNSDHMGELGNTGGPSWVARIVDAVGTSTCTNPDRSSYWSTTAIIITWDDWGGWYDHEPPTIEAYPEGGYQMGFRVPLIVVSATTPAGTISNSPEDFGSIVRFIEQNFGIFEGALTFADARSTGDLTEFFASSHAARSFKPIRAPLSKAYFLNAKPSGVPPDTD